MALAVFFAGHNQGCGGAGPVSIGLSRFQLKALYNLMSATADGQIQFVEASEVWASFIISPRPIGCCSIPALKMKSPSESLVLIGRYRTAFPMSPCRLIHRSFKAGRRVCGWIFVGSQTLDSARELNWFWSSRARIIG